MRYITRRTLFIASVIAYATYLASCQSAGKAVGDATGFTMSLHENTITTEGERAEARCPKGIVISGGCKCPTSGIMLSMPHQDLEAWVCECLAPEHLQAYVLCIHQENLE